MTTDITTAADTSSLKEAVERATNALKFYQAQAGGASTTAIVQTRDLRLLLALSEQADRLEGELAKAKAPAKEKRAPVQGLTGGIPWSLHLKAYDAYAKRFGRQDALIDLEGRNCRGGFSTGELDMFVPGWRDELSELAALKRRAEAAEAKVSILTEALRKLALAWLHAPFPAEAQIIAPLGKGPIAEALSTLPPSQEEGE